MNAKQLLAIGLFALCTSAAADAVAHGGMTDLRGTVNTVAAETLVVDTIDGARKTVRVSPQTVYYHVDEPAAAADLRAGDRVAIEAKEHDGALVAVEVRFNHTGENPGAAAPQGAGAPGAHTGHERHEGHEGHEH